MVFEPFIDKLLGTWWLWVVDYFGVYFWHVHVVVAVVVVVVVDDVVCCYGVHLPHPPTYIIPNHPPYNVFATTPIA